MYERANNMLDDTYCDGNKKPCLSAHNKHFKII